MIFANIIYFLIVISIYSMSPKTGDPTLLVRNITGILILSGFFCVYVHHYFAKIKKQIATGITEPGEIKRQISKQIQTFTVSAIILFIVEIYLFQLKSIFSLVPIMGKAEIILNIIGIAFFILHLAIVWMKAAQATQSTIPMAPSVKEFVWGHVKFNLAIIIPWLIISLLYDLLSLIQSTWFPKLDESDLWQLFFFILVVFITATFAPVLIRHLWSCHPLPESSLKEKIDSFCRTRKVRFRQVLSWDALNRGLLTAAVIGLFPSFRYLLITPRLMDMLEEKEIMAVVAHETGHVKKKHMFFYLLFFIGFVVFGLAIINPLLKWILLLDIDIFSVSLISSLSIFISVSLFIVYFRFIFGYFMRNFERQADLYCFDSQLGADDLISSFTKLGQAIGDDGGKSNWHHFSIPERIDFLKKCQNNPKEIGRHHHKVKKSLFIYTIILIVFSVFAFNPKFNKWETNINYKLMVKELEHRLEKNPTNPGLYAALAAVYYEQEKWEKAKTYYERSLSLDLRQPDVLNNLAWLLLTCPDQNLHEPDRALKLALEAARLKTTHYILDTLAEAYLANAMYEEAIKAAEFALKITPENKGYYQQQVKKIKKARILSKPQKLI